jgi:hypothetical protein
MENLTAVLKTPVLSTPTKKELETGKIHNYILHRLIKDYGYSNSIEEATDKASEVVISLIENDKFNPEKSKFTTYVEYRIKTILYNGNMKKKVRANIEAIPASNFETNNENENTNFSLGINDSNPETELIKNECKVIYNMLTIFRNNLTSREYLYIRLVGFGFERAIIEKRLGFSNNGAYRKFVYETRRKVAKYVKV